MRIKHKLEGPDLDDVKEQLSNGWIPIVASVVTTALVIRFCSKPPQVNIYLSSSMIETKGRP